MTTIPAVPIHLYISGPTPTTIVTACGAQLAAGQAWRSSTHRGDATCPACLRALVVRSGTA